MPEYDISYDILGDDPDYDPIIQTLLDLGAVRVQRSNWRLKSHASAALIHLTLSSKIKPGDRLKVTEINPANTVSSNEIGTSTGIFGLLMQPKATRQVPLPGLLNHGVLSGLSGK